MICSPEAWSHLSGHIYQSFLRHQETPSRGTLAKMLIVCMTPNGLKMTEHPLNCMISLGDKCVLFDA